jgi:hypothetical protein
VVIFNPNLDLNSHLYAQHMNLNHHYIPLVGMLSHAEGLPLHKMTSNGVVGAGPFWSAESHMAKNCCCQDS